MLHRSAFPLDMICQMSTFPVHTFVCVAGTSLSDRPIWIIVYSLNDACFIQ